MTMSKNKISTTNRPSSNTTPTENSTKSKPITF